MIRSPNVTLTGNFIFNSLLKYGLLYGTNDKLGIQGQRGEQNLTCKCQNIEHPRSRN